MRIGELARRAGVTAKAVRYYESLGLLAPARLTNGYRDYGEHDVRLTREIRALGRLGIPAEGTRPFLECLTLGHGHVDDCPAALAGYRDAIAELTERIEGLTARRAVLAARLHEAAHRGRRPSATEGEEPMTGHMSLPADLPVPQDDGAAAHLPGTRMPRLELQATDGTTVGLEALGAGRTVLYVYPLTGRPDTDLPEGWDSIPGARGCTAETCGFRDHHSDLLATGAARVYGLSSQDSDYQRELTERLHLPFQMLSDVERSLARALELPTFTTSGLTLYKRLTLIIKDDVIEHVFYPVFPPDRHADQVLAWLGDNPL
ncbi:MerR family transcriptional regulator [Streptomyces sp. NPDC059168]|uniref:MerR family transcriptional regulator n=1 Tax=Streptomyces sp. NPDC059168 TaxID=3346753 RepID=UPI0036A04078